MRTFSGLLWAAILSALLLGCGSSSHKTAQSPARCPSGKSLLSGHFHFSGCVPSQDARVLFICDEAAYELEGILHRASSSPQPGALQHLFEQAARESIATMKSTATKLAASGENVQSELAVVSAHRAELVSYLAGLRRAQARQSYGRLYKALSARDGVCRATS